MKKLILAISFSQTAELKCQIDTVFNNVQLFAFIRLLVYMLYSDL